MQRGKVISYASRQLKIHEKNYTTHDLELGAVVFDLKNWRHYLYKTKRIIYTDHKRLQHIFDHKELIMRQRRWIELFSDYDCEIRYHPGKADVSGVKDKILTAQGEASKVENVPAEMLCVRTIIMDEDHATRYFIHPGADKIYHDLRDMYWWPDMEKDIVLANVAESIGNAIGYEYYLSSLDRWVNYHSSIRCAPFEALYERKCRSPVLWAEIRESWLIGPEMVQETIDKVVHIKERLKEAIDYQKSYADNRLPFDKKGKLAPRYVGPFEIVKRIGPVAYRLRLPQELSSVHDTFHMSNLKKCLADTNLHVPLEEIKVEKSIHFIEEPVEIMDREVKRLKRSRIPNVKVR
ncbi:putative reverse transcriptase domain-containing protein [Tanacetum coccineum]